MKQKVTKIFGGAGTNVAEGLSNIGGGVADKFVNTHQRRKSSVRKRNDRAFYES